MRQVWISRVGGPEVLTLRDAPDPLPGRGEIRIRVAAIGVNFADIMARLGLYPDAPPLPAVVGYEVAGTVDAIGSDVELTLDSGTAIAVGDDVMALTKFGGYSDVVCVPAAHVFRRPSSMSARTAVAFLLTYATAYVLLIEAGRIRAGDRVLIRGAAGGVGLAAVDICRLSGADVIATASANKHEFLRSRGIDNPIDPRKANVADDVRRLTSGRGVDVVLDPVGGRSWSESFGLLSPFGRVVLYGFSSMAAGVAPSRLQTVASVVSEMAQVPWLQFTPVSLMNNNRGASGVNLGRLWDHAHLFRPWLSKLLDWYAAGQIDPYFDRDFPLDRAADAHRYIQERRNIGKVGLIP